VQGKCSDLAPVSSSLSLISIGGKPYCSGVYITVSIQYCKYKTDFGMSCWNRNMKETGVYYRDQFTAAVVAIQDKQ
jgi:hypothetical protein